MEVVELVHPRGIRASLTAADGPAASAADLAIVARVACVEDGGALADDEQAIDVAVHPDARIAIDGLEQARGRHGL